MVRVDSREPKHIARFFRRKGWSVQHAKFADCADIADDALSMLFERKHRTDLISSIYTGRLFNQCERMFNYCEQHDAMGYVVISGNAVESIDSHSKLLRKQMNKSKPRGHKVPASWRINLTAAQVNKYISMIPWHYDINVLWFITEEEALEAIHYMLQEMHVSDPYSQTLNKKRRRASKARKKAVHHKRTKRRKTATPPEVEEDTYEYFVKLGLIEP